MTRKWTFPKIESRAEELYKYRKDLLIDVLGPDIFTGNDRPKKEIDAINDAIHRFREYNENYDQYAEKAFEVNIDRLYNSVIDDLDFFQEIYENHYKRTRYLSRTIPEFIESIYALERIRNDFDSRTSDILYWLNKTLDTSLGLINRIYVQELAAGASSGELNRLIEYGASLEYIGKAIFRGEGIRNREITEKYRGEFSKLLSREKILKRAIAHGALDKIKDLEEVRRQIDDYIRFTDRAYNDVVDDQVEDIEQDAKDVQTPEDLIEVEGEAAQAIQTLTDYSISSDVMRRISRTLGHIQSNARQNQARVNYANLSPEEKAKVDKIEAEKKAAEAARKYRNKAISDINKKRNHNEKELDKSLKQREKAKKDAEIQRKRKIKEDKRFLDEYSKTHDIILVVYPDGTTHLEFRELEKVEKEKRKRRKVTHGKPSEPLPKDWEERFRKMGSIIYGITGADLIMQPVYQEILDEIARYEAQNEEGGDDPNIPEIPKGTYDAIALSVSLRDFQESLGRILSLIGGTLSDLRKIVDNIYSDILPTIGKFEDFFNAPLEAIIKMFSYTLSVLSIGTSGISVGIKLFTDTANAITGAGESGNKDDKDEPGEKQSTGEAFLSNIFSAVNVILTSVALSIDAAKIVITFGLSAFTDMLGSILKLVKTIAKTSPIMERLSSMVNLIYMMFFLPFSIAFGNKTLDSVIQIVLLAEEAGFKNLFFWQQSDERIYQLLLSLSENNKRIKEISESFIDKFLPDIMVVFANVLTFTVYFAEAIFNNSEDLINVLNFGIEAASEMLNAGILTVFLKTSIAYLKFFKDNATYILGLLSTGFDIMKWCLGATTHIMKHFELFCIAMGGAIMSMLGALGGARLGAKQIMKIAAELKWVPTQKQFLSAVLRESGKEAVKGGITGAIMGEILYRLLFKFGEGGYIPAVPGGTLAIVAEKETEYIIPKSKVHLIRGQDKLILNYTGNVYGLDREGRMLGSELNNIFDGSEYR